MPQVVFLAMLLNDAMKLGMLCRWMIGVMESALKELQWSTFQAWVDHNRDRILEACPQEADSDRDEEESSGETFKWHLRMASLPARPLSEDYQGLCLSFTLPDAEEVARDFNILQIVQAIFYAMVVKDAVKLSVVNRDVAGDLRLTLKGLRWTSFESWLSVNKYALLEAQLAPGGNLGPANG
ncbi:hypothetical protein Cgig2_005827 [Carnegiea gigantea]|uniref:Uncharacterized protein n=1 Tax=Carnegiea gigantea TaxID=171969 RepID=A0A9Q1QLT7_9CARY|nr:hypothetical protein Cgig2_005827 [Carnegiea gigantea]